MPPNSKPPQASPVKVRPTAANTRFEVNDTRTSDERPEDAVRLAWRVIRSSSRTLIDMSYTLRRVGVPTPLLARLQRLAHEAESIGLQLHRLADEIDEERRRSEHRGRRR